MLSVFQVVKYLLLKTESITTLALHNLLYYCQVASLTSRDKPLFEGKFKAYEGGPRINNLLDKYRSIFILRAADVSESIDTMTDDDKKLIDDVFEELCELKPFELSSYVRHNVAWILCLALRDEHDEFKEMPDEILKKYGNDSLYLFLDKEAE